MTKESVNKENEYLTTFFSNSQQSIELQIYIKILTKNTYLKNIVFILKPLEVIHINRYSFFKFLIFQYTF